MNTANAGNSPSVAPPRAVIFDIGRVIVRVNIARALAMVGGGAAACTPEQIWSAIEADALWDDWEKGKVEPREWYRHLASKFDSPLDFDAFAEAWCSVLDPTPIIGDELFRELSARCRLGLLSNTDVLHVAYMEKNFSFVRFFPVRIYSCSVGMCKPAPEIYEHCLQQLGVAAPDALFLDDREANIRAAKALGLSAVLFADAASASLEIERRFALPAPDSRQR